MRKLFTVIAAVLLTASVFAQSPEKMSYQAVIRNSSDALVTNTQIGMEINIRQGSVSGTVVYTETQTPTTNANGLVSIEIGGGAGFNAIDWSAGPYFIETKTAVVPPLTTYTITGTSQLMSVPYALHAKTAESVTGGVTETDPIFTSWDKSTGISITESQINDLGTYIETETDPVFTGWDKDYSDLINTPTIPTVPTVISAFTNDAGYLTSFTETDPSVPTGTQTGEMQYWNGSEWVTVAAGNEGEVLTFVNGIPTWKPIEGKTDVTNPTTGKIWMDRNLGASQVATSSTDSDAYGDLYQWGRATDGHQIRTSGTTSTLSGSDIPGHGNFIANFSSPYDWRNPQNDDLWQGVSGTNNPCPSGYRLPTDAEWEAERISWGSNNSVGAFASPLKLPMAGYRFYSSGTLSNVGSTGFYWSSTVDGTFSRFLYFYSSNDFVDSSYRAYGFSVRCLKD